MKKIILIISLSLLCACSLNNTFTDKYLYSTVYPIEYAAESLYNEYSNIDSVYPNGANKEYIVTEKKKDIYANADIFVYSGLLGESSLTKDLLNRNNELKIIDATKGMNLNNDIAELWLDPSNYLMLCSNIKRSLIDYNNSYTITATIEKNYEALNEKISELDVSLYNLGKNGTYNTILTTNNVFNFLKKYNINVVSLDEENTNLDKNYADAKKLISEKKVDFIYMLDGEEIPDSLEKFISDNGLIKISINNLYTITDEEVALEKNYISIMKDIIDEYKRELYKN